MPPFPQRTGKKMRVHFQSAGERLGYGVFEVGNDADLVVLDARSTPQMALRMEAVETLANELFLLQTCGDDRAVVETYVAGRPMKSALPN